MQHTVIGRILFLIQVLLLGGSASAQGLGVHLPLQGYFHPGRLMPVIIDSPGHSESIRISGENVVPIKIPRNWSGEVPVLILAASPNPTLIVEYSAGTVERIPLIPLEPDQRLIAVLDGSSGAGLALFPGQTTIEITQAGYGQRAFGSLDALVENVSIHKIGNYKTLGIDIATRAEQKPSKDKGWERSGDFWIFRNCVLGPRNVIGGEEIYRPVQSWRAGTPPELRRQVFLIGVLVSLFACSIFLLRTNRARMLFVVAMVALTYSAIKYWSSGLPKVTSVSGEIDVQLNEKWQMDRWRFIAAGPAGASQISSRQQPVLYDANQARQIHLSMNCLPDGDFEWTFSLPPDGRLALFSRIFEFESYVTRTEPPRVSPLLEFALREYFKSDGTIEMIKSTPAFEWGSVLIRPNDTLVR